MEIIDVSGYTLEEKVQIGKRHLLPKHLNESGLAPAQLKVPVSTIQSWWNNTPMRVAYVASTNVWPNSCDTEPTNRLGRSA